MLIEWANRNDGLYVVADQSAAPVQRRYIAAALGTRFTGFEETEYPDWHVLFRRLDREVARIDWNGPLIIDEFPYLTLAEPEILAVMQNWLDSPSRQIHIVLSGSSARMMQSAILDQSAPLYGRATEAFPLRPLRAGFLADAFPGRSYRELISTYAVFGGVPRYWELAEQHGANLVDTVDALVLDPNGPLHREPARLLSIETPPATALRPILDVIGNGAHRVSEIAGRLGRQATSLAGPLATLIEMDIVRKETPFGSDPKSGKRSLYQIADPFLRFWFRVVAPNRSLLANAPRESRLLCWEKHRIQLEATVWEDLCRMAVPHLHRLVPQLAEHGPFGVAQRYWHRNDRELDIVARSLAGPEILVGEAKWRRSEKLQGFTGVQVGSLPIGSAPIQTFLFTPDAPNKKVTNVVDAQMVLDALH